MRAGIKLTQGCVRCATIDLYCTTVLRFALVPYFACVCCAGWRLYVAVTGAHVLRGGGDNAFGQGAAGAGPHKAAGEAHGEGSEGVAYTTTADLFRFCACKNIVMFFFGWEQDR